MRMAPMNGDSLEISVYTPSCIMLPAFCYALCWKKCWKNVVFNTGLLNNFITHKSRKAENETGTIYYIIFYDYTSIYTTYLKYDFLNKVLYSHIEILRITLPQRLEASTPGFPLFSLSILIEYLCKCIHY